MTRHLFTTIACLAFCFGTTTAMAQDTTKRKATPQKPSQVDTVRMQNLTKSRKLLLMGKPTEAIKHSHHELDHDLKMPAKTQAEHYKVIAIAHKRLKNTPRACHFFNKAIDTKQLTPTNEKGVRTLMQKMKCH